MGVRAAECFVVCGLPASPVTVDGVAGFVGAGESYRPEVLSSYPPRPAGANRTRDDRRRRRPEVASSVAAASRALRDAARRGRSRRVRPSPRRPRTDVLPRRAHRRRRRARVLRVPRLFSAGAVADARGRPGAAQRVRADVRRARIARTDHRCPATRPQRRRGAVRVRHAAVVRRPAHRDHRRVVGRRPQRVVVVVVSLVKAYSSDWTDRTRRFGGSAPTSRVGTHSAPTRWAPDQSPPDQSPPAPRAHDALLRVRRDDRAAAGGGRRRVDRLAPTLGGRGIRTRDLGRVYRLGSLRLGSLRLGSLRLGRRLGLGPIVRRVADRFFASPRSRLDDSKRESALSGCPPNERVSRVAKRQRLSLVRRRRVFVRAVAPVPRRAKRDQGAFISFTLNQPSCFRMGDTIE